MCICDARSIYPRAKVGQNKSNFLVFTFGTVIHTFVCTTYTHGRNLTAPKHYTVHGPSLFLDTAPPNTSRTPIFGENLVDRYSRMPIRRYSRMVAHCKNTSVFVQTPSKPNNRKRTSWQKPEIQYSEEKHRTNRKFPPKTFDVRQY